MRAALRRNHSALRRLGRQFARAREGLAMLEFAMVLPAMLAMYFGIVEVAQGVMASRKVSLLNRALADLTSQARTLTTSEVDDIFAAAGTVMMPYASPDPGMMIASVVIDAAGTARVCWVEERGMTAPFARGDTVTLPTELRTPNTSVILARARYEYAPTVAHHIVGSVTLGDNTVYMRPRLGDIGGTGSIEQVSRQGVPMCPN